MLILKHFNQFFSSVRAFQFSVTGKINYYNDHIQKYHVLYDDSTEDYIGEDEIDMIEICIV